MIKLKQNNKYIDFDTTIFPDGTSQTWKFKGLEKTPVTIEWYWENNEAEIFHLFSLCEFLANEGIYYTKELEIPYLPYARQDKPIGNSTTFNLSVFANVINELEFNKVTTFDVHSIVASKLIRRLEVISPKNFHKQVQKDFKPDLWFYPDKGAYTRYRQTNLDNEIVLYGEKFRDPETGVISAYKISNTGYFDLKGKRVLIVDDICDGGATFITAAQALKALGVGEIGLAVSHGIFSKGYVGLVDAGVTSFYTTNSLIKPDRILAVFPWNGEDQ